MKVDPDWWKTMFDEVYLLTDARSVCDKEITRREVDLICELLPISPGHRILDLCGGHGRHSLELCSRGFAWCTVLDYSLYLIDYAKRRAAECNYHIDCIQGDARCTALPSEHFDHVLIMGNSMGYIPDPASDSQIIAEANRVLRPGGWLLIDVTNRTAVINSFNPTAWHEIGTDIVVCRQRKMEGNTIYAREMVLSKKRGVIRDRTYSLRLYDSPGVGMLLDQAGFRQVKVKTDFSAHQGSGDYGFMNCRMVAAGQKP